MDFCQFEAVNDEELKLLHSGKILRRGNLKNLLCIIANYLIDTLCNDAFQIEKGGVLKEGLISVGVKQKDADNCDQKDGNNTDVTNANTARTSTRTSSFDNSVDCEKELGFESSYMTISGIQVGM